MSEHDSSSLALPTAAPGKIRAFSVRTRVWDAIVLGAGASGLFCAMTAASRGKSVLLVDHAEVAGRKLSITGGGKCNITNRHLSPDDYHSENPNFCRSALARFTPQDLISILDDAGIALEEREHGQLFCRSSAKDVVRFLVGRCAELGCTFALQERVLGINGAHSGGLFSIRTAKSVHQARKVVLALGGPAWPQVGATGVGHELARTMGHGIVPVRPALAGLVMPSAWPLTALAGIALLATVRIVHSGAALSAGAKADKKKGAPVARQLPLLFTHNGLSGPAALQASLYWRPGMGLELDMLPFLPEAKGVDPLLDAPGAGKTLCRNILKKALPGRLCDALLPKELGSVRCAELGRGHREALAAAFRAHTVLPVKTEGFAKAEVAAGGVSTEKLSSKNMESRLVPGLHFCGELLDVTGRLGGCNLHWAFASGKAVGSSL